MSKAPAVAVVLLFASVVPAGVAVSEEKSDTSMAQREAITVPGNAIADLRRAVDDLRDHTSGWVNVRSYGATGDGTTDDTAAIAAAVASGKSVFVPDGYAFVTSGLTITTARQVVFGHGRLKLKSAANRSVLTIAANNVVVEGVEIDGNAANQALSGTSNNGPHGHGIYLTDGVSGVAIRKCYIHDAPANGISGYGNHSNMEISGNRIEDVGVMGIYPSNGSAYPFAYSTISNNRITMVGKRDRAGLGDCIWTVGIRHSTIGYNVCRDPVTACIALEAGNSFVSVIGNICDGRQTWGGHLGLDGQPIPRDGRPAIGIQLNDCSNIAVTGNIIENTGIGVAVGGGDGTHGIAITGNVIRGAVGNAFQATISSGGTVGRWANIIFSKNVIEDSYNVPIFVQLLSGLQITDNSIAGVNLADATHYWSRYGVLVCCGAANVTVAGNLIAKDSATGAGHMDVGIGEIWHNGLGTHNNFHSRNRVSGATYYDIVTLSAAVHGAGEVNNSVVERISRAAAEPAAGYWNRGDTSQRASIVPGRPVVDACVDEGQFGGQTTTGTIGFGGTILKLANTNGFFDSMRVRVAGAGVDGADLVTTVYGIDRVSKTCRVTNAAGTTVSGAAVTLVQPSFRSHGDLK